MSKQDIELTAADWVTRLRDPQVSLEDTIEWQRWMEQDVRHAKAFARMEQVAALMQSLPRVALPDPARVARDRYDASVPIGKWHERPRYRPMLAIAASILVAAIALMWTPDHSNADVLRTAVGENRTVRLADGSKVTLGGDTQIEIRIDAKLRRIDLSQGEAFFSVAKDSDRSFTVIAGDTTVVAVGTEFNVRRGTDRVVVAVVEGAVVVEPHTRVVPVSVLREIRPTLTPVSVTAGQQTIASSRRIEAAAVLPDPSATTAWQRGRLPFRFEPLRYVVEDVNRYLEEPIVIEDESIGELTFTGTVMVDNVEGWIASLRGVFGIEAVEEDGRIVLQRPRSVAP